MDVKKLYHYALDQALAVGVQVQTTDMDKPTPDTEWTVRDLLQHIMTELVWIPDIMAGKKVGETGDVHNGDLLGTDLAESWRVAVEAARQAVQKVDLRATAHLSYTDKPVGEYLLDSADDVLIHSWDLGQAIGAKVVFDEKVAQTLYDHMKVQIGGDGSAFFARAIKLPPDAGIQSKLLALLGRTENWSTIR